MAKDPELARQEELLRRRDEASSAGSAAALKRELVASRLMRKGLSERKFFDSADASMAKGRKQTVSRAAPVEQPISNLKPVVRPELGSPEPIRSPGSPVSTISPLATPVSPDTKLSEGPASVLANSSQPLPEARDNSAKGSSMGLRRRFECSGSFRAPIGASEMGSLADLDELHDSSMTPGSSQSSVKTDELLSSVPEDMKGLPTVVQHANEVKKNSGQIPLPASNLTTTMELGRDGSLTVKSDAVIRVTSRAGSSAFSCAYKLGRQATQIIAGSSVESDSGGDDDSDQEHEVYEVHY